MKLLHHQKLRKRAIVYCMFFKRNKNLGLLLTLLFLSGGLQAQTQINKYCFNSDVNALAKAPDGGIYIGGNFTNIAEYCGRAVKFNTVITPGFNINDVRIEGTVRAIVPIPQGGWYVGGNFLSVSGIPRVGLARINADGSLHHFNSFFNNSTDVFSLAIDSSGKLYVGGYISSSYQVMCFDPEGTLNNFNPIFDGAVNALALDANGNLLVGGAFTSPRNRLAKFSSDGILDSFNPVFNTGVVNAVKFNSAGDFFVGGSFTTVNGLSRNRFAKFNANMTLNSLDRAFNGNVMAIAVDISDNFYVGGNFTIINSVINKAYLVKFNASGSINSSFTAVMNSSVLALEIDNSGVLYCGGNFTQVVGLGTRNYFAKFNADGTLNSFDPSINGRVNAIAVNPLGSVYAGGAFSGINSIIRNRLAKLNADGSLHSFNPSVNNLVNAITVDEIGNLYIGGTFTAIGSNSRMRLAKFNPDLTLSAFNGLIGGGVGVNALAVDSANNLYVGGFFQFAVSDTRIAFAKFNANGTLSNFNPIPDPDVGMVNAIAIDAQDNIYIGGYIFSTIMGQPRRGFVKFNANETLAELSPFFYNGQVFSLALDGFGNIYAGGEFTSVNGEPRTNLVKINADGSLSPFNHTLNGNVKAIEISATGNLFIGGTFTSIDGITNGGFAKISGNGNLNSLNPGHTVNDILLDGSTLHVAGSIQNYKVYTDIDNTCDLTLSNPIPASRCGAGTVQLSITPSSGSVNWYDAPANGNLVGTGTTFTTPNISNTTTYYAEAVDGACFSFTRTAVTATITTGCESIINLKLFVQGYYTGNNTMASVAYNQGSSANTNEVETLTVELWDPVTQTLAASTQALLKTDGTAICNYPTAPNGSYYLAVKGSNFIKTWSASPVTVGPAPLIFDFTDSADKAYLANMAPLGNNVFGFHSGDINQDNSVDTADYSLWEFDGNNYAFGVYPTDLNGDGIVDFADYSFWEYNNNNYIMGYGPW